MVFFSILNSCVAEMFFFSFQSPGPRRRKAAASPVAPARRGSRARSGTGALGCGRMRLHFPGGERAERVGWLWEGETDRERKVERERQTKTERDDDRYVKERDMYTEDGVQYV